MNLDHPPFIDLPRLLAAVSDYPGNMADRQLLACISQFANEKGEAWPTTRYLAKCLNWEQDDVSSSVKRLQKKGTLTITKAKKGNDRHPRNVYQLPQWCVRSTPDPASKRYADAVKKKKARLAGNGPTPAQAREARARRGGGFAGFGGVLTGLFPTASAPVQAVRDDYSQQVPRGGWSQALREHEAAAVMASQPTQTAAPMSAAPAVPPVQQPPTQPTPAEQRERMASEQRERKAQAYDELQQLRKNLRQPTASSATQDTTTATTPAVEQDTQAARDYWKQKLREHEATQDVQAAPSDTTPTATTPTAPAPVQPGPAVQQPPTQPTADEWDTWPEADEWDEWETWTPDKWEEACQQAAQELAREPWPEEDPWPDADDWEAWAQLDEWEDAQPIPAA